MAVPLDSNLRLLNDSVPRGANWWEWSIWIDGHEDELAQVESVTYRLHPTFPQPVQKVTDRSAGFRFRGAGWGEFTITAEVRFRSGRVVRLERWLELRGADGKRPSDHAGAGGRRPTVFVSASAVDGELVSDLAAALQAQGIDVRREQDVETVSNSASEIDDALRDADGVVAVFSDPRSPWVESEFERARAMGKTTFPVILGDTHVPSGVTEMVRFELKQRRNVGGLADTIAARLKDKLVVDD